MSPRLFRRKRAARFSEGARLLWLAMERDGLSQEATRLKVGVAGGQLGRWLRGERLPAGPFRGALFRLFSIDPSAWDVPPSEPFKFPAHSSAA